MEHIERVACILVIQWRFIHRSIFLKKFKQRLPIIQKLALGLNCVGMMNIQFVIHENRVYVIEVNPRASRTVPFLSKITGIPMAQVATKAILGEKLTDLGYQDGLYPESKQVHVKAPVFSFTKLQKVDTYLGPEMKSTGEVMGSDYYLEKPCIKPLKHLVCICQVMELYFSPLLMKQKEGVRNC